jgi:hypothetical protein
VLAALVPVRNAAVALAVMDKLRPRLCPAAVPAWAGFIPPNDANEAVWP